MSLMWSFFQQNSLVHSLSGWLASQFSLQSAVELVSAQGIHPETIVSRLSKQLGGTIWTQTPWPGEPCVFRPSRVLLNCSRVAQCVQCCSAVPCCLFVPSCSVCAIFVHRRHWVASISKFIGAYTVSMLKNWHYLIESCLDLNLNLGFWSGDSQSEYFYAQETLNNELWPSFRNKLIKSNFCEKKTLDCPGHGICIHISLVIFYWPIGCIQPFSAIGHMFS